MHEHHVTHIHNIYCSCYEHEHEHRNMMKNLLNSTYKCVSGTHIRRIIQREKKLCDTREKKTTFTKFIYPRTASREIEENGVSMRSRKNGMQRDRGTEIERQRDRENEGKTPCIYD